MNSGDMELGMQWICDFVGVTRFTLYKWLQEGKVASLHAKDLRKKLLDDHEKYLRKKWEATLLVKDISPLTSPPASPPTGEVVVSSSQSKEWMNVVPPEPLVDKEVSFSSDPYDSILDKLDSLPDTGPEPVKFAGSPLLNRKKK